MLRGATPRMLICVSGEASGVPGSGEIVGLGAAWSRSGPAAGAGGAAASAGPALTSDTIAAAPTARRRRPCRRRDTGAPASGSNFLSRAQHTMKRPFEEYHLHVNSVGRRPRDPGDRLSTRREILAATDRLLRRHPYSEVTAEALAAAARVWLRAIVDFFYRNGAVVRTLSEASLTDERIARAYNGFLDRFTELTAFGLDRMVTDGRIEPLDPWPVARALNMMNERYLLAEFGHGEQGSPDAALKTLETIWLRAFAPTGVGRRALSPAARAQSPSSARRRTTNSSSS